LLQCTIGDRLVAFLSSKAAWPSASLRTAFAVFIALPSVLTAGGNAKDLPAARTAQRLADPVLRQLHPLLAMGAANHAIAHGDSPLALRRNRPLNTIRSQHCRHLFSLQSS
jgi:hypothetical protein